MNVPSKFDLLSWMSLRGIVTRFPRRTQEIYLTFDDGPHPEHTPRLLSLLAQYGAQATFFMIGDAMRRSPDVVRSIHAHGHELANHSTTHPWFDRLGWRAQLAEISATEKELAAVDGKKSHRFRPPHGRVSGACLGLALLRRLELTVWSVDSLDYRMSQTEVVAELRTRGVAGGDILLFHDDAAVAGEVLEQLLPEWRARGLACRPLPGRA